MNAEERENIGVKPLQVNCNLEGQNCRPNMSTIQCFVFQDKLKEFGGWPVLEGLNWNSTDIWNQVLKMNSAGFTSSALVTIGVMTDSKQNTRKVNNINMHDKCN